MTQAIQVVTTTERKEDAQRIAAALVDRRLAACVQIDGPIESVYRWKDAIETAQEWRCTAKTTDDRYTQLEAAIRELHPYDEPEILATRVVACSPGYLKWLDEMTRPA